MATPNGVALFYLVFKLFKLHLICSLQLNIQNFKFYHPTN